MFVYEGKNVVCVTYLAAAHHHHTAITPHHGVEDRIGNKIEVVS